MSEAERGRALRAFQKQQAWWEDDRQRRAIFGDYRGAVTVVHNHTRLVGIGDRLYHIPDTWIPFQFFTWFATSLLTHEPRTGHFTGDVDSKHPIAAWARGMKAQFASAMPDADGSYGFIPNDATTALVRLGYEAFIVQNNTKFRDQILERLRIEREFDGARHELSVGAFLTMAGFDVEYLPEDSSGTPNEERRRTPDIDASHKEAAVRFHVEAKRKHRERSESPDPRQPDGSWKLAITDPLRKAMKQLKHRTRPWMVCVDLDLPCPIPNSSDRGFFDAVDVELAAIERNHATSGGAPEVVLFIEMPYHSVKDYNPTLRPQIIPVVSASFRRAKSYQSLEPFLRRAQEQFPRMPFTWDELGAVTANQAQPNL